MIFFTILGIITAIIIVVYLLTSLSFSLFGENRCHNDHDGMARSGAKACPTCGEILNVYP